MPIATSISWSATAPGQSPVSQHGWRSAWRQLRAALDTTALALGNFDPTDSPLELVVGTELGGLQFHQFSGGVFQAAITIDGPASNAFATTSLAAADVDADGDLDFVVGNLDQANRLYLNQNDTGTWANVNVTDDFVGQDATSDVRPTFAVALGNIDNDATGLDLVTGNDRVPGRTYLWTVVEAEDPDTGDPIEVAGYLTGSDIGIDPELVNNVNVQDPLPYSTSLAMFVTAEATAGVSVGAGVTIAASDNVNLSAHANAKVDILTQSSFFGFTFGDASPTATVVIENGASITAAGDFDMAATTTSFLKVTSFIPGVGESTNLSGSGATLHANSLADINNGATIVATNVDVTAENHNQSSTRPRLRFGTTDDGDDEKAASLVLGFYQSHATATIGGWSPPRAT